MGPSSLPVNDPVFRGPASRLHASAPGLHQDRLRCHRPGATLSSARSAGGPSTSRPSSPRTGTTATSGRSTASTPCSPAAPRRSGWCRWWPAAPSARPPASWESQATDSTWPRKSRIYSGAGQVHSNARKQPDPLAFEAALQALAAELDEPSTPRISYQQRRRALETWPIGEDTWKHLVSRLPPVPGPQRPDLGDRKRQIASIYAWVQVTSGEHRFAPRPVEAAQPPEIQQSWKLRRNTIWHLMQSSRPRPHYTSLKTELNTLATSLARTTGAPRQ